MYWPDVKGYLATGMENNLRLFVESRIYLKLNNSCGHSSFARSALYQCTENQSRKCAWKQAEDGSS